jgi:hypothetical protein
MFTGAVALNEQAARAIVHRAATGENALAPCRPCAVLNGAGWSKRSGGQSALPPLRDPGFGSSIPFHRMMEVVSFAGLVRPPMAEITLARGWPDGLVAAMPATRKNAVTPTATAPMTENATAGLRRHGVLHDAMRGVIAGDGGGCDEGECDQAEPRAGGRSRAEPARGRASALRQQCRRGGAEPARRCDRPRAGGDAGEEGSAKTASVNSSQQKKPMAAIEKMMPRKIMVVYSERTSEDAPSTTTTARLTIAEIASAGAESLRIRPAPSRPHQRAKGRSRGRSRRHRRHIRWRATESCRRRPEDDDRDHQGGGEAEGEGVSVLADIDPAPVQSGDHPR